MTTTELRKTSLTAYAESVATGEIVVGKWVRLACQRHLDDLKHGHERGLWFDDEQADRLIQFFSLLRHSKGEWAGQPLHLEPWQQFVIGSVFGWRRDDGTRRFRTTYNEVARKNGKALSLLTPLATPDGWVSMGDIDVGDRLFDETGAICRVVEATPVMNAHDCFEVEFADGSRIIADAGHLWKTKTRRNGRIIKGVPRADWASRRDSQLHTTQQIADSLELGGRPDRVERNHSIAVAAELDLPERSLPLPPYALGVWLGDGDSKAPVVTKSLRDRAVMDEVEKSGVVVERLKDGTNGSTRWRLGGIGAASLRPVFKSLHLLFSKHIPAPYLRSSREQRKALLQGLMDTDGYAARSGQCEYSTTTPALAEGVRELIVSLGMKVTVKETRAMLYGKDCGPSWRLQFWSYSDRPAFRLARKFDRLKPPPLSQTRTANRKIVAVRPVPSVPVRCVQVDSPSRLYLAGRSMIPTHNSTLAAGLGLYLAFFDDEPGAEVYSAATKRDQAKISWGEAKRMVQRTPGLSKRIQAFAANLSNEIEAQKFEPLSADYNSMDGLNIHGAIIDELHRHKTRDMWDVLQTGTGARREPLTFVITTAGYDRHSICWEQHDYATKVLEGIIPDDSFFAYIAAIDEEDDWTDPAVWVKANPNLGISVKLDALERDCQKAQDVPGEQNAFKRLRLSVWTEQADRWLDMSTWDAAEARRPEDELEGEMCFGAIDLSSTTDLTALTLWFPRDDGGGDALAWFWLPEDNIARRVKRDKVPYDVWVREGLVTGTDGNVVDYDVIRATANDLAERYNIREMAIDRWNSTHLQTQLMGDGFDVVPFGQGFASMSAPTREIEKLVLKNQLRHGGNPVLRWMASNVAVKQDPAGNLKIDKAKSTEKVDGMVALAMCVGRAMVSDGDDGDSVYEGRGVLTIG